MFEKPLKELESAKSQKGRALSSLKRRPRGGCTGKKWQSGDLLVKEENRQLEVAMENFEDHNSTGVSSISVLRGADWIVDRNRRENAGADVAGITCMVWTRVVEVNSGLGTSDLGG